MGYFRYVHILIGEIHRYHYEMQSNLNENDQPGRSRANAVKTEENKIMAKMPLQEVRRYSY